MGRRASPAGARVNSGRHVLKSAYLKSQIPVRFRAQKSLFIRDGINKKIRFCLFQNPSIFLQSAVMDVHPQPSRPCVISSADCFSSTHRALGIDELIRNISYSVEITIPGMASLLAFACCCKSLEGPVMDILWLRQVDLLTILRSLPAGSWVVGADRDFVREKLICPLVTF